MNITKFLPGFPTKLMGSSKRKTQDTLRRKSEALLSKTYGGFCQQFGSIISADFIDKHTTDKRTRVFNQEVTFWAWLSQVLSFNASCSYGVSQVQAWRTSAKIG